MRLPELAPSVLVIAAALLLASCQPLLRLAFGIKKMTPMSSQEIEEAAIKHNLKEGGDHASFSHQGWVDYFKVVRPGIDIELYDKDGYRLVADSSEVSGCLADDEALLISLEAPQSFLRKGSGSLEGATQNLFSLDGAREMPYAPSDAHDYTALIYWASFLGKHNKKIESWQNAIDEHPDLNIRVVYINLDKKNWWPEDDPEGKSTVRAQSDSSGR